MGKVEPTVSNPPSTTSLTPIGVLPVDDVSSELIATLEAFGIEWDHENPLPLTVKLNCEPR